MDGLPYLRVVLLLLFLTASFNALDVLTTLIGLQIGLDEGGTFSLEIMQAYGVMGFSLIKIGAVSFACVAVALLFRKVRAARFHPIVRSCVLVELTTLFGLFAWPVPWNILLITQQLLGN